MLQVQAEPKPFDLGELSRRIDEAREERRLTMAALANLVGVSSSTIRRFRTADDAEADGVLALISWLGDPPERFIERSAVVGAQLLPSGTGYVRVDMDLVDDTTPGGSKRTRTTIQRLATAAQERGCTISSLTRWSRV